MYLPLTTPTNDWYGGHRPGANLFAESIVALGCRDRKAAVALPGRASRDVGLRLPVPADSRRHHRQRTPDQGARAAVEAGVSLRLRSHQRQAGVADRRASGAERRRAGRVVFADPAGAARRARKTVRVRPAGRDRRRSDRLHARSSGRRRFTSCPTTPTGRSSFRRSFRARASAPARRDRSIFPARTAAPTGPARRSIRRPTSSTCRRTIRRSSCSSCRRPRART